MLEVSVASLHRKSMGRDMPTLSQEGQLDVKKGKQKIKGTRNSRKKI